MINLCCQTDWIANACTIFAGLCSILVALLIWRQQKKLQQLQSQNEEERNAILSSQKDLQKQIVLYNRRNEQKEYWNYLVEVQDVVSKLPELVIESFCSIGGPSYKTTIEKNKNILLKVESLQSRLNNINSSLLVFAGKSPSDDNLINLLHQADLLAKLTLDLFKVFPPMEPDSVMDYRGAIFSLLKKSFPQKNNLQEESLDNDKLCQYLQMQCQLNTVIEGEQWYHDFLQQIIDLTKIESSPQAFFPNCISDFYKYYERVFGDENLLDRLEQVIYINNL